VHLLANAMTAIFTHNLETGCTRHLLDGVRHIAQPRVSPRGGDPGVQSRFGNGDQPLRVWRDLTYAHRNGRISLIALVNRPYIQAYNIARRQLARAGDAVNDLFVYRGADRRRIPVIAFERRRSPQLRISASASRSSS
jgi:hypothetical protein